MSTEITKKELIQKRINLQNAANRLKLSIPLYRLYRKTIKKHNILKKTILIYFEVSGSKNITHFYNLDIFSQELGDLFNLIICSNITEFVMFYNNINFEAIIVNSDVATRNLNNYIVYQNPNIYNTHKIIIIQTINSYDLMRWLPSPLIYKKEILNNIYLTCKPHQFDDDNQFHTIGIIRSETADFVNNLNSIGNIKKMPLFHFKPLKTSLTKDDFYKKYNFDSSKQIVTIFLSFPCNGHVPEIPDFMQQFIETYFLNNIDFMDKVVDAFKILGYNVAFKIHPFLNLTIRPLVFGPSYEKRSKQREAPVSIEQITKIIEKFVFYDQFDFEDVNVFTDLGVSFTRSTVNYNCYMHNIPLLIVSNEEKIIERQHQWEINFNVEHLIYGEFVTIEDLEKNTYNILSSFILKYKNKPEFKFFKNNPLFGDIHDFQTWKEYIIEIMKKPIIHSKYIIDSKLAKEYKSYTHPSHRLLYGYPDIEQNNKPDTMGYILDPNKIYCDSSVSLLKRIFD